MTLNGRFWLMSRAVCAKIEVNIRLFCGTEAGIMNKGSSLTFKITALVVGPMLLLSAVLSVMFSATNYIRSRNAVFHSLRAPA